jgi:hypothetical protein
MKKLILIIIVLLSIVPLYGLTQEYLIGSSKYFVRSEMYNSKYTITNISDSTITYIYGYKTMVFNFINNPNYKIFKSPKRICSSIELRMSNEKAKYFIQDKNKQPCWLYLGNNYWEYSPTNITYPILIKKTLTTNGITIFTYSK